MLAGCWRTYANIALTGGNLSILPIALKFPNPGETGFAAVLTGISSLYAWYLNLERYSAAAWMRRFPPGRSASTIKNTLEPGTRLLRKPPGRLCLIANRAPK